MVDLSQCPWSTWAPGTVHFCEARICGWIREPADAWSSVAYLLGAVVMIARRQPVLAILAQVLIGVGSFFFHASGTFVGELVDQMGMYLLSCLMLAYAAAEARRLSEQKAIALWAGLVAVSTALNVAIRPIGIPLFALELTAGIFWQVKLGGWPSPARYRALYTGIGIFVVSFGIWITDITGLVCDPNRHWMNGHAIWHTLDALSIVFLGHFYAQRPAPDAAPAPAALAGG